MSWVRRVSPRHRPAAAAPWPWAGGPAVPLAVVTLLRPVPSLGWSLVGDCLRSQAPTSSTVQKNVGSLPGDGGKRAQLADAALAAGPLLLPPTDSGPGSKLAEGGGPAPSSL